MVFVDLFSCIDMNQFTVYMNRIMSVSDLNRDENVSEKASYDILINKFID